MHEKFICFLSRNKKGFLLLFITINIISLIGLLRITINTDFALFMPKNSQALKEYEEMIETFGSSQQFLFLVKSNQDNDVESLQELFNIQQSLTEIEGVKLVNGPVPAVIPAGMGVQKVQKIDESNSSQIIEYISKLGSMQSFYEKEENYYGLFTILPDEIFLNSVAEKAVQIIEKTGLEYYKSGEYYLQSSIFKYILRILLIIPPFAIFFLLLVFSWKLGDIKSTYLSLLPAGIGALWSMGFLGWLSLDLSVITVLTPVFTIVMGSADGLHFMSHLKDEMKSGKDKKTALALTLEKVGWPMILTTLTTAAGFLSLLVIQSEPMRQLAFAASIGISLAGIATWVFLPLICLLFGTVKQNNQARKETDDLITRSLKKSMGKGSILITIIIFIAFIPGLFLIKTDLNMINLYKPSTEIRKNMAKIEAVTGGTIPIFIEFVTQNDPLDPDVAKEVLALEEHLKSSDTVSKTFSVYEIFSTINQVIFGSQKSEYPQNKAQINLMITLMQSNQPEQINNTLKRNEGVGRIVVFPKNLNNHTLSFIEKALEIYSSDVIQFKALGMPFIMKEMNDRIIPDQVSSILLAIGLVFILMVITLRKIKLALIGIVPLGVTLIALFGFMGYTGIELSIVTCTMASITIGVGIDYSIHLTSLFKYYYYDKKANNAADLAFEYVQKPVIANALGLALGLSSLLFSPLQFHTYLSMLMWVTMIISSFVSLTFLPTLLKRVFR
ncbi:MAG: MMPL family transporter [Thermotogota bacterium]|nr:MMPL family transporter [Thermotogota bacterium]